MHAGADGRDKVAFFEPRQDSFSGSFEEEFEQMRMLLEEVPQIIGDSEGDMIVLDVG